ncbi:MAG: hypothetical protein CO158_04400 [Piscirickettsiaceae bacterium CG_4_9_14_3_um_filter_43_564]|nr:exo-alpha-sialidase [Thiomicrospira sp.]OIP96073.1 MAG: hypothetical protein AUK56_03305 [Thiomicrospira sp. CG2_30_44_34]PIQ03124.1 MAG: hypothetical protein COW74_08410 [Piscirickettsiaceae bacterium CG18_big_fil_WC_8_21_14_2_50_44_103]PIU39605.1 MAG: hypothetical protein COT01_00300 [Piscirickettsiaceae bacterium CG07_land_8_20_14_0_80_44_28]PIW57144.1 MAG: hypothetical protein COW14_07365 [Piscirickettsiaceae bacterium CG12_big_fil_rev_8_21_14_0_65_44_934]PIW78553.1 MAG: hypothetical pr
MTIALSLESVKCLWDKGAHNAFTDLIEVDGIWYCAFRQAQHHMSFDGKIVILCAKNDQAWQKFAEICWAGGDCRDPKFVLTPQGKLMLMAGVRWAVPISADSALFSVTWQLEALSHPFVSESDQGTWRWSGSANQTQIFSIGYAGKDLQGCLYTSDDGRHWQAHLKPFFPEAACFSNESSLVFSEDGTGYCLLRRDGEDCPGALGESSPPYQDWQWQNLSLGIGGPKMIHLSTGELVAAFRVFEEKQPKVVVYEICPSSAELSYLLTLPSKGDCSYPGLVEKDGQIWVSYYSSHQGKSAIYLAKLNIKSPKVFLD